MLFLLRIDTLCARGGRRLTTLGGRRCGLRRQLSRLNEVLGGLCRSATLSEVSSRRCAHLSTSFVAKQRRTRTHLGIVTARLTGRRDSLDGIAGFVTIVRGRVSLGKLGGTILGRLVRGVIIRRFHGRSNIEGRHMSVRCHFVNGLGSCITWWYCCVFLVNTVVITWATTMREAPAPVPRLTHRRLAPSTRGFMPSATHLMANHPPPAESMRSEPPCAK